MIGVFFARKQERNMAQALENLNIETLELLITPEQLKRRLPVPEATRARVVEHRLAVKRILQGEDPRLLVVVGPCSIHDTAAAKDYAARLLALSEQVGDALLLVMRAYFEKPRTTVGWKGLINDPHLDDSFDIAEGLGIARRLLLELAAMGLPLSTEALDPITPQYLQDLISWSAIGARTSESQTHREMASGLSAAVGFKNGTDGSLASAINAIASARRPHRFLGINGQGQVSVIETRGNADAHIVLRGGDKGPNYEAAHVEACEQAMSGAGLPPAIMVDCSHANSGKRAERQPQVARAVLDQVLAGNRAIIGLMLESHIHAGRQEIPDDLTQLRYGVSVTDACIGWKATADLLSGMAEALRPLLADADSGRVAMVG